MLTVVFNGVRVYDSSDFKEEQHPRSKGGEFAKTAGGGATTKAAVKKPKVLEKKSAKREHIYEVRTHHLGKVTEGGTREKGRGEEVFAKGTLAELAAKGVQATPEMAREARKDFAWAGKSEELKKYLNDNDYYQSISLHHVKPVDESISDKKDWKLNNSLTKHGLKEGYKAEITASGSYAMTDEQRDAVENYQSDGSAEKLNKALREGKPTTKYKSQMAHLDAAIAASKLTADHEVWRGLSGAKAQSMLAGLKPGDVIKDSGYTSVSFSQGVADGFAQGKSEKEDLPLMRIKLKKGSNAVLTGDRVASTSEDEYEAILPRDNKLKFTGVKRQGRQLIYEFEN